MIFGQAHQVRWQAPRQRPSAVVRRRAGIRQMHVDVGLGAFPQRGGGIGHALAELKTVVDGMIAQYGMPDVHVEISDSDPKHPCVLVCDRQVDHWWALSVEDGAERVALGVYEKYKPSQDDDLSMGILFVPDGEPAWVNCAHLTVVVPAVLTAMLKRDALSSCP